MGVFGVVEFARIHIEPFENLAKREEETPNRKDAKPDLFGVSLVQMINQDHPPYQGGYRTRLE
jgi:hypothetical protein